MRRMIIVLFGLLVPLWNALGFQISGNVSGRDGLALTYVYTIPTTLDTFYVTVANLFNGNYSQTVDEGGYMLFAFQDANFSFLPDIDEARGFYGGQIPQVLEVTGDTSGVDIELLPPNTGGFTGTVTYEGTETGATYVIASRSNTFEGLPNGVGLLLTNTGNGDYTAIVDSFGVYYAYAYMDANGNLVYDIGEPYDVWGDDAEPEPMNIIQGEGYPTDINFELIAIDIANDPAPIARHFRLGTAYPNPFNAETTIPFTLDRPMELEIVAHDILGRTVTEIVRGNFGVGEHSVRFGHGVMASGMYMIEMRAENTSTCIPVVLLK